jgi:hypothetical protein
MKVTELLLELHKNPLAYRPQYDGKTKSVMGAAADWFKLMGVTPEHIKKAMDQARKLPEYKAIVVGAPESPSPQSAKFGTFSFTIGRDETALVSAMGQIRYQSGASRGRVASPKPSMVHGDPVAGLVKTYKLAFAELVKKPKIAALLK